MMTPAPRAKAFARRWKLDLIFVVLLPLLIGLAWGRSSDVFPDQPYAFGALVTLLVWAGALWLVLAGRARRRAVHSDLRAGRDVDGTSDAQKG